MQIPGAYHADESLGRQNGQDDEILPGYDDAPFIGPQPLEQSQMDVDGDEGIDVSFTAHGHQSPPWVDSAWSFSALGSGRPPPSQMLGVPPGSLDFNPDTDADEALFDGDGMSTKADDGDGGSTGQMSDVDEGMKSIEQSGESAVDALTRRNERESAPPPHDLVGRG